MRGVNNWRVFLRDPTLTDGEKNLGNFSMGAMEYVATTGHVVYMLGDEAHES